MHAVIEDIIRQKPHLTDTLRFYEKAMKFHETMREGPVKAGPHQNAYAPELIGQIFERFSSFIELPAGSLNPLKQAMELGEIDFTRLPLGTSILSVPAVPRIPTSIRPRTA